MKLVGGGINLKRETLSSVLQNAVLIVSQLLQFAMKLVGEGMTFNRETLSSVL